ncbi:branched-chain amino acid transporter permease [Haematomicrobium sanguinis]|uniref:branched-chain amino acid transporter permease n=1 Tax=Haematomicrobium sanguinis TaxID=479106 RepID=UPI00047AAF08|nr:AzlD domain-containing protein [Haematomicrobium sanguinis]
MSGPGYTLAIALVIAAVTQVLRWIPFALPKRVRESEYMAFLQEHLPVGFMLILTVYTLMHVNVAVPPYGIPEASALAVTFGLYYWRKNLVVATLGGIVCYLLLVNLVF